MITKLLWKKIGMSQIISENWTVIPVTYVEITDNEIIQIKTQDKDWYNAVVLWVNPYNQPTKNKRFQDISECRVDSVDWINIWDKFGISIFGDVSILTVTWFSKWKWTAWTVKRWNKSMQQKTHWSKDRRHWTTMNCSTHRSRKGIKMAWRMWNERVTLRNREIPMVDIWNNVLAVKWTVPWAINWLVILKKEVK